MPRSACKLTWRASLVYVGTSLLMTAGAVTIADQPLGTKFHCTCKSPNWNQTPPCDFGGTCWQLGTGCSQLPCVVNFNLQTVCAC